MKLDEIRENFVSKEKNFLENFQDIFTRIWIDFTQNDFKLHNLRVKFAFSLPKMFPQFPQKGLRTSKFSQIFLEISSKFTHIFLKFHKIFPKFLQNYPNFCQ